MKSKFQFVARLTGICLISSNLHAAIIASESYRYTAGDNTLIGTTVTGFTGDAR